MFGNSRAKSALQDAVRILTTVPGRAPNSQRLILEAAQRRARDAASLVVSAQDRTSKKLWADAELILADCAFRLGQIDEGFAAMLGSAATYLTIVGDGRSTDLANATFAISRAYSRLGDSRRAALFAAETFRRTPRRERNAQRIVWCFGAMIAAGDRSAVAEGLTELPKDQLTEPSASMFLILEHVSGYCRHSLASLLKADDRLEGVPAESALLFKLTVAAELRAAGRRPEAREILERLLEQLADQAAPSWTIARVRQVMADLLVEEQRYLDALHEALASWVVLDECRYLTGSPRLRRTIHDSYALARRAAMTSAVGLQDWVVLTELIEAARLQSSSDIEGSLDEFDAVMNGRKLADRAYRDDVRTINLDEIPTPYNRIYDDLTNSRTDLATAADITIGGRSMIAFARENARSHALHITVSRKLLALEDCLEKAYGGNAMWWSTWHERGLIFWTVSPRGGQAEGGYIDLDADQALRAALTACYDGNRLPTPWSYSDPLSPDLHQALRACDSPEELDLSRALARLLPAQILQQPKTGQVDSPTPRLLISAAPDLSCVPWAVLPIGGPLGSPVRLIEQYELQFVPSLVTIANAIFATDDSEQKFIPFVMSCDYLTPDSFPIAPRAARARFGTAQQCTHYSDISLATPEAIATFLRNLQPGTPGLSVFRTHFTSIAGDPTASGFELNGGILEVGWLLPRDLHAGRTILSMTSRVLLSCCSTSASQERYGGESLGLVAACLQSGARMIVATSVNIPHTSFTNAFDQMLVEMMLETQNHVSGLNYLQRQMLREWRARSNAGVLSNNGDIRDALPVIWAYYQACGVG